MAAMVKVTIETELGDIGAEIEVERAPITAANFLRYVDAGFYDGGRWHRTVLPDNQPDNAIRIEVIQAGVDPTREDERFAPIPLERTTLTGLSHRDGTISMARFAPDSAVSDVFICIGDQPSLDFGGQRNSDGQGFAAFGRVTSGMDIVRAIQHSDHEEQRLTPPIAITRIVRR
jgi:peptidyl-prolyl cis-trans isomerase A (cyclophilin A)